MKKMTQSRFNSIRNVPIIAASLVLSAALTFAPLAPTAYAAAQPNGHIVYVGARSDSTTGDYAWDLYSADPNGHNETKLTNTGYYKERVKWSPDGTKLSFVGDTPTGTEIFVMNADGSNEVNLTNNDDYDFDSAWSPDGTKIVFTSDRNGDKTDVYDVDIYAMNADGSNVTQLTNNSIGDVQPTWSTNNKIAFASNRDGDFELFTMDADGQNQTQITTNAYDDFEPDWSPNGANLVFSRQTGPLPGVYIMTPAGSAETQLTTDSTWYITPSWSPKGNKITFSSSMNAAPGHEINYQIFTMNPDGTDKKQITNVQTGWGFDFNSFPDWGGATTNENKK